MQPSTRESGRGTQIGTDAWEAVGFAPSTPPVTGDDVPPAFMVNIEIQ